MDQVCALNCTVAGLKPSMRPVRYREVRLIPLKYVRNFIFDPFVRFFPFDSLGCIPENPCPDCRVVRIVRCPICRGSTVPVLLIKRGTSGKNTSDFGQLKGWLWSIFHLKLLRHHQVSDSRLNVQYFCVRGAFEICTSFVLDPLTLALERPH